MERAPDHRDGRVRTVVVGLDGSDASNAALGWLGRVIPPDGVIHAVHARRPADDADADHAEIDRRLSAWTREVRDRGVDVRLVTAHEAAVDALVRVAVSVDADDVVVVAHASGRHGPRLVGRTVRALIARVDRPLVVVPERTSSAAGRVSTVVAGVGRGASTRAALRWAAAYAGARHTPLCLVRAVERRPFFDLEGLLDVMAYSIDPRTVRELACMDVAELADEIRRSTDEELAIAWSAPSGPAGPRLVEAASDAALLVVGRREHPAGGHRLSRSLEHTIKHAPCPIVIVPTGEPPDARSPGLTAPPGKPRR